MAWDELSDESLDELLQQARWPESDAEQVARIDHRWRTHRARQRLMARTALAAVLLIAATIVVGRLAWRGEKVPGDVQIAEKPIQPSSPTETKERIVPVALEAETEPAREASSGQDRWQSRPPTVYEQTVLLARRGRKAEASPHEVSETQVADVEKESLRKPTSPPEAASSDVEPPSVEELFAALRSSRVSTRLEAARALGELNDPAVSARLVRLALDGATRREALVALLNSSDPIATDFLAYARTDVTLWPSLRAAAVRMNNNDQLN